MNIDLTNFEQFSNETHVQLRAFLNLVGMDLGAYILLDEQKIRNLSNSCFSLKIADCNRTVTLEFNNMSEEDRVNSLYKIKQIETILHYIREKLEKDSLRSSSLSTII